MADDSVPPPVDPNQDVEAEAAGDEEEIEDLFGDDDEEGNEDLFGDDDEGQGGEVDPEAEPGVESLFGSSDEGEADAGEVNEEDLFGGSDSEDEEAGKPAPPSRSDFSEMDERDIFGDVSDDEPEKELSLDLEPKQRTAADQELVTMRLPNIISFDEMEYGGIDSISDEMLEGYKEYKNTRGNSALKLMNPENCVRWRFEEDEYGNRILDDDGKEIYESNTRLVEWEDGSWSFFVGSEAFQIQRIEDRTPIFEENSRDVYICEGSITQKFIATPKSMESASHEMLKKSQYRKYEPVRRSILMTEAATEDAAQALEIQANDQKTRSKKRSLEDKAMTAGFLEDDASVHGPSVADIKKQYRDRPAKRLKDESDPN
eukprot:symbB.v1.2.006099.t1/scaffold359.1/size220467/9